MDLDLSDDQELFRSATWKYLDNQVTMARVRELAADVTGFDPAAWSQGAELGWFSMLVPEEHGGGSVSGRGVADLAIIVEELGRVLFPGPVIATNLVAGAIASDGSGEQCEAWLPSIVAGDTIATWAVAETSDCWDGSNMAVRAKSDGDGYRLNGTKTAVKFGAAAHLFLVTAVSPVGIVHALVPVATPGLSVIPLDSLDLTRRFAEVRLDDVEVPSANVIGTPATGAEQFDSRSNLATTVQCAETVGAMDRTFEFTLEYATVRKAFGRPIGSFQVLKHRFADMVLWIESSKAATEAAVAAVAHDVDVSRMASVAKAYIGQKSVDLVRDCLQIHGGIGFTWEHDIHLYLRRVESNRALYGSPEHHLDRIAGLVGL